MTMKERLEVHRQIEAENEQKKVLFERFEIAKKILGFYPGSEAELVMFEHNGYDDGSWMYR